MVENQSHLRGENGFSGRFDLFGAPLKQIRPECAPTKRDESSAYAQWAKGRNGANSPPAVGGEKGESPRGLALTPLPTPAQCMHSADSASVVNPPAPELLQSNINDEALTFARQLRTRFADCRLTYHATDGRLRGRLPYWWAEVAR